MKAVDKNDLDRIIISSNEKMEKIIDWVYENKDWCFENDGSLQFPLSQGLICLEEENIDFSFEVLSDQSIVITVYMGRLNIPTFMYQIETIEKDIKPVIKNIRMLGVQDESKKELMNFIVAMDNTAAKEALKFIAIMAFMANFEEIITVDKSKTEPRSKSTARLLRRKGGRLPMLKKTYVVNDFEVEGLRAPGQPRSYTKPDHEVGIRGHWRHYKSGKKTWIKEHVNYKQAGTRKRKEYGI